MTSLVADNPYDVTQQKFAGTGDVTGSITGGARNGENWNFMDQQGNVLTSVPYQDYVNNYQSNGSGAVRDGVTSVNGVPVYNFQSPGLIGSASPAAAAATSTTQAAAPATQSPASGLVGGNITNTASGASAYTPALSNVNKATETAAGQVESLLSQDSPLMQRARALATQQMAQRGLVNSSMNQGAGVAAMIDRITPIAQQDASTYATRTLANQEATNTAGMFNAGESNKFAMQTSQQNFQAGQNSLDRELQVNLQKSQQNFQSAQAELDRAQQVALADKSIQAQKDLQAAQQVFQGAQAQLDRAQQASLAQAQISANQALQTAQQQFQSVQAQLDRENQASLTKLQNELNQANVSKTFAANTALNTSNAINQVLVDPNIKAEDKSGAISNIVNAANSTIQWGSTFYNTPLPTIAAPNGTAGTVTPGGSYSTGTTTKPAWQTYLDANPDVVKAFGYSKAGAESHFQQYGVNEQRVGNEEMKKAVAG